MGDIDEARLEKVLPFTNVCVDLFGPFTTRANFSKKKRKTRGAIFTSLFSRAVYLDTVLDYSTPALNLSIEIC